MCQLVGVLSEHQLLFWIPFNILSGITEENGRNVILTAYSGAKALVLSVTSLCFCNTVSAARHGDVCWI